MQIIGGTITQITTANGIERVHTFKANETIRVVGGGNIRIVLAGGGGAGGGGTNHPHGAAGGGGGAGEFIDTNILVNPGEYNIIIGAGGVGVFASPGNNGGNTSAFGITAIGGGGGGANGSAGKTGACGGGGSAYSANTSGGGGGGTKGFNGGSGTVDNSTHNGGGGGGGMGGIGGVRTNGCGVASPAGAGVTTNITGSTISLCGGGGGGSEESCGEMSASAGGGQGSHGYNDPSPVSCIGVGPQVNCSRATIGTPNTGGGGGGVGSGGYASTFGKNGGSGIVIVRYIFTGIGFAGLM
jgi:hypothetical protein